MTQPDEYYEVQDTPLETQLSDRTDRIAQARLASNIKNIQKLVSRGVAQENGNGYRIAIEDRSPSTAEEAPHFVDIVLDARGRIRMAEDLSDATNMIQRAHMYARVLEKLEEEFGIREACDD